jgi:hypothetical protein
LDALNWDEKCTKVTGSRYPGTVQVTPQRLEFKAKMGVDDKDKKVQT